MNDLNKKVVVVTGCTGQMGSYFCEFLLSLGYTVIGTIRRLSVKNHVNIEHINNDRFILAPMDLGDPHSINTIVSLYKPDYFINCAANSFVKSSWECPEQHMDYNALGVLRQLEAIRNFSPHTRYINFGSSEEMGDVIYSPQDEKHPPRARSVYGASKVAARQIIKVYRESYGLFAVQCWCFNYESQRRGEEFVTRKIAKGVARIKKSLINKEPFSSIELGSLDAKRDWSHATDFVDGIWKMINLDKPKEYVFSSGETHQIREFVEKAFKAAGIDGFWLGIGENECYFLSGVDNQLSKLVSINPKFYRPADVELLLGDSSLARKELGWSPKVTFEELVKIMVSSELKACSISV
jgi:GDPmannose 4,6-dehydratase